MSTAAAFDFHRGNFLFARLPFKCPLSEWLWDALEIHFGMCHKYIENFHHTAAAAAVNVHSSTSTFFGDFMY